MSTIKLGQDVNATLDVEIGYTTDYQFTLYEADAVTGITLQATDNIRCKVGTVGGSIILDIDNDATASGSVSTITQTTSPAVVTVRFAQGDTAALTAGTYDAVLVLVDDSETAPADAAKVIARFKVRLIATLVGTIDLA